MNTALISGGTSGIGLATAAVLDRGWQVAVSSRDEAKGRRLYSSWDGKGCLLYKGTSAGMKTAGTWWMRRSASLAASTDW